MEGLTDNQAWFRDPTSLLDHVRQGQEGGGQPPAIGGYENLREVRRGGQGVIYRGVQIATRREVAIKVLLDGAYASPRARRRFEREVELVAGLRHPHIVQVYDSGSTAEDQVYLVMEYVEGPTLDGYVAERFPAVAKRTAEDIGAIVELLARVAEAVQYAHQRGVIHRDLKPGNVRVGSGGEPRVLDFGLAKSAGVDTVAWATSTAGGFVGSLPWAAPEQVGASAEGVDTRTDLYALGVLLYQLLTGGFPYPTDGNMYEAIQHILATEPPRPGRSVPQIGEDLDTIVGKCLVKAPDRRYQSAGELALDMRRFLAGEPIEAKRDSTWYALRKNLKRYRRTAIFAGVLFVLTVGYSIVVSVYYARAVAAEETARTVNAFLDDMFLSVDAEQEGHRVTVAQVLDRAADELSARTDLDAATRASLYDTLGSSYHSLGDYAEAADMLQRAVTIRDDVFGRDHESAISSAGMLALSLLFDSRIDEALALSESARTRATAQLGAEHTTTLRIQYHHARILSDLGETAAAIELEEQTLAALRRTLGDNHLDTLRNMKFLGSLLHVQMELEEAETLLREAYRRTTENYGHDHPDALTAGNNLAVLLEQNGESAEAEALYRHIVEIQTELRGRDHPETLISMNNLSDTLSNQERYSEAEALVRDVLDAQTRRLGAEHVDTLVTRNNLGRILHDRGQLDEAFVRLTDTLEVLHRHHGERHPMALRVEANRAAVLMDLKRFAAAEAIIERLVAIHSEMLGPEHPTTLIQLNNLGAVLMDQDRHGEAMEVYDRLLAAAALTLPEDHWWMAAFKGLGGEALTELGRYAEAEAHLLEAHAKLVETWGTEHMRTQKVVGRLITLYERWGRPAAVERWKEEQFGPAL